MGPGSEVYLTAVMRTEWASNAKGNGAAAHAIASLKTQPADLSAADGTACSRGSSVAGPSRPGTAKSFRSVDTGLARAESAVAEAAAAAGVQLVQQGSQQQRGAFRQLSLQPGDELQADEAEACWEEDDGESLAGEGWAGAEHSLGEQGQFTGKQHHQQHQQGPGSPVAVQRSALASLPGGSVRSQGLGLTVDGYAGSLAVGCPSQAAALAEGASTSGAGGGLGSSRPTSPKRSMAAGVFSQQAAVAAAAGSPKSSASGMMQGLWLPVGHATAVTRSRPATAGAGTSRTSQPQGGAGNYMPSESHCLRFGFCHEFYAFLEFPGNVA